MSELEVIFSVVGNKAVYRPSDPGVRDLVSRERALEYGQRAEQFLDLEASELCEALNTQFPDAEGNPRFQYEPKVSYFDPLLDFYKTRQEKAPNVVARWGAFNHAKLASEAWGLEDFRTLKSHPKAVEAERCVRQGSWGEAYSILASFTVEDNALATGPTVEAYLAALVAEGFSPS